ncbi:hypothetical protein DRO33_02195, partial [Candidatus Bathyarchaeota archaeon]
MVPVPHPLLQAVLSPLLVSALALLTGRRLGPRTGWLVGAFLAYQTALLAYLTYSLWLGKEPLVEHYAWIFLPLVG